MNIYILLALLSLAFIAGVAFHFVFYEPTKALTEMWRNLVRYAIGVLAVMALTVAASFSFPVLPPIYVALLTTVFFVMFGTGVLLGYTAQNGDGGSKQ